MAQRWSTKEDIIIGKYCIENPWAYSSDYDIENMMKLLDEAGCQTRSSGAIKKRAYAFEVLLEQRELPSIPKQVVQIYNELVNLCEDSDKYQRIKSYIREFHKRTEKQSTTDAEVESDMPSMLFEDASTMLGYEISINERNTFPRVLQRIVDSKGIKTYAPMCRRIGMKPDTFGAILRGKYKEVKKDNVLRICVGLELSLNEAEELLLSAGFAFSNSIMMDLVIKSFLWDRCYNVVAINAELYENKERMLFEGYIIDHEEFLK